MPKGFKIIRNELKTPTQSNINFHKKARAIQTIATELALQEPDVKITIAIEASPKFLEEGQKHPLLYFFSNMHEHGMTSAEFMNRAYLRASDNIGMVFQYGRYLQEEFEKDLCDSHAHRKIGEDQVHLGTRAPRIMAARHASAEVQKLKSKKSKKRKMDDEEEEEEENSRTYTPEDVGLFNPLTSLPEKSSTRSTTSTTTHSTQPLVNQDIGNMKNKYFPVKGEKRFPRAPRPNVVTSKDLEVLGKFDKVKMELDNPPIPRGIITATKSASKKRQRQQYSKKDMSDEPVTISSSSSEPVTNMAPSEGSWFHGSFNTFEERLPAPAFPFTISRPPPSINTPHQPVPVPRFVDNTRFVQIPVISVDPLFDKAEGDSFQKLAAFFNLSKTPNMP